MVANKIKKKLSFSLLFFGQYVNIYRGNFSLPQLNPLMFKKIAKTNKLPKRETNKNHDKKNFKSLSTRKTC